MAEKRPLCNYSGSVEELHSGDTLPASSSGTFPFYVAAGTLDSISLISGSALPFFVANGSQDNINLVV